MPAKNPRINVVVEKPLYNVVHELAKESGLSMSMVVRDLLKEALEAREDLALAAFAVDREETFDKAKSLTHDQVWE